MVEERKLMQLQLVECAARKYLDDGKAQCRRLTQSIYEAKIATNEATKQLRAVKVGVCSLCRCKLVLIQCVFPFIVPACAMCLSRACTVPGWLESAILLGRPALCIAGCVCAV